MVDRTTAREIAGRDVPEGLEIDDDQVRELTQGWFFPYRSTGEPIFGSQGVIVNKTTGKMFQLGSAFPVERDLDLYDKGYQFEGYDLVITGVADIEGTLDTLEQLLISTVERTYEHGTVWRVGRTLARAELRSALTKLPCVFGPLALYFQAEALDRATETGAFAFELLEYGT